MPSATIAVGDVTSVQSEKLFSAEGAKRIGDQLTNLAWPGGISPMITSTKSTHESVPFKHSVARLYSTFMLNIV